MASDRAIFGLRYYTADGILSYKTSERKAGFKDLLEEYLLSCSTPHKVSYRLARLTTIH
jgi:hypothetical protein